MILSLIAAFGDKSTEIDWTSIILAAIAASAAMFSAYQASLASRASRLNSVLLKTNSGMTIGQHIEKLQEDQMVLRDELSNIAQEKLKADAALAASSLKAIAKLTEAADMHIIETAQTVALELLNKADKTATELSEHSAL